MQILLITSRDTGRWVIPKGNIGKGKSARAAAEQEASEEAGLRGAVEKNPLGVYSYGKVLNDGLVRPTSVEVYAMQVHKTVKSWPEMAERRSEWMTPAVAAGLVHESGLAMLILALAARYPDIHSAS